MSIQGFKSLKQANLKLGRLNFLLGANASGKSNVLDALRVLRGLAGGFPIKELFEGGARIAGGGSWPGIRGGLSNAIWQPVSTPQPSRDSEATLQVRFSTPQGRLDYEVAFNADGATTRETLAQDDGEVFHFEGIEAHFKVSQGNVIPCYPNAFLGSQLVLAYRTGLAGPYKDLVETWINQCQRVQLLEPEIGILRAYGAAADLGHMGEHGENFASLVRHIQGDPSRRESYLSWLRELRPREVDEVEILTGAVGEPLFALREGDRRFPAPVLSDGTLRFAALTAALLQPDPPEVLAVEEIENGIHASRLRLVVELLRSQAGFSNIQVLATTHSPLLLSWLKPEECATTFVCVRDRESGESIIRPLTDLPRFSELVASQSLTDLLMEGWLEVAP